MTRLKRNAERIREGAAEGIAKSLEGLPAWKPDHSEGGRLRRKIFSVFFLPRKTRNYRDYSGSEAVTPIKYLDCHVNLKSNKSELLLITQEGSFPCELYKFA